jgi:RHS repeat-associated protein
MTYNYNTSVNRLTSITGANAMTFGYDAYGNVTSNGAHGFTYNRAGDMTSSTNPAITYKYDGHKRRVQQTEGGQTEYTMYSQSGTLLHKKVGGVTTDYLYAGELLIAKNSSSSGLHYLHTDLLGSPIKGKVGSTSYTEHYRPWGEKKNDPIQLADDVGYTGHQSDVATGLTYMQARYYDPVVGRFMAVDPVGFFPGSSMSFNRYMYVNGNSYKYVDPHGLTAQKQPDIEVASVKEEITTEITVTTTESADGEVFEEVTVTAKRPKQDSTSRRIQTLKLQEAYFQANAALGAAMMLSQQDQQLAADYVTVVYGAAIGGAVGLRLTLQVPRFQIVNPGMCAALLLS